MYYYYHFREGGNRGFAKNAPELTSRPLTKTLAWISMTLDS